MCRVDDGLLSFGTRTRFSGCLWEDGRSRWWRGSLRQHQTLNGGKYAGVWYNETVPGCSHQIVRTIAEEGRHIIRPVGHGSKEAQITATTLDHLPCEIYHLRWIPERIQDFYWHVLIVQNGHMVLNYAFAITFRKCWSENDTAQFLSSNC